MAVVPFTQPQGPTSTLGPTNQPQITPPDQSYLMMAAAQMHSEGRLFQPTEKKSNAPNRAR